MASSHSDSHHPPPYDDADDPLISKPEKPASPPICFDSREQFRWHLISLSGRCLTTALSLSFLILGLLIFSRKGVLSHMEQYGFNALTILLSAFASLGLGSMLGYLGTMLRWRLLARKKYKMQDIELLLAMPSPSGSAALLYTHFREQRLSLTTFIVMLYLFVNITGRFSVAIFGLTYNLLDDPNETPCTYATDWTSVPVLLTKNATDLGAVEGEPGCYLKLVQGGLIVLTGQPDILLNTSVSQNLTESTLYTLGVRGSTMRTTGNKVEFSYDINYFNGTNPISWGHIVNSSASCTMFRLDGDKYWKDGGSDNQTSEDWKDGRNTETIADVLRVLDGRGAWPRAGAEWVTWAAPLARRASEPSVTYVVYHETAWECESTLDEVYEKREVGDPLKKTLFDSASLFLLPITGDVEPGQAASTAVLTKVIIGYPKTYTRTSVSKPKIPARARGENKDDLPRVTPTIGIRSPQSQGQTTKVWMETSVSLSTGYRTETVAVEPVRMGKTTSVAYRSFAGLQNQKSPSVGVQALNFYGNGQPGYTDQKPYYSLYVAALVARLPIVAIAFGNRVFPHVPGGPKPGPTKSVATTLEVKWGRVALAAGIIVASQILVITAVLYYCQNVYVPEDRYLATAELLKPVLNKIDDGTAMTREEFESALDKALGGPVCYGTIPGSEGDCPRVALGRQAGYNFPGFPPFRKRSIFRR